MSKRNISYVKPEEPSFLRKLKEQIGYKEGPTVETKRENLAPASDEEDACDEQPTVVVLKPGDLTAEEAAQTKEKLEKEKSEAPADLNARIVFKAPQKSAENTDIGKKRESTEKLNKTKAKKSKPLLSFAEDDDDDDEF